MSLDPVPAMSVVHSLPPGWREVLDEIDERHSAEHRRLREDLQNACATLAALTVTVDRNYRYFEDQNAAMRLRANTIEVLAQRPVDATTLTLSTRAILGLIGAVSVLLVTVMGTYFAIVAKVDNVGRDLTSVREQMGRMEQQRLDDKREAQQKLSDFLNQRLESALANQGGTPPAKGRR